MTQPSLWLVISDKQGSNVVCPNDRVLFSIYQTLSLEKQWCTGVCHYNERTQQLESTHDHKLNQLYTMDIISPKRAESQGTATSLTKSNNIWTSSHRTIGNTSYLSWLRIHIGQIGIVRGTISASRKVIRKANSVFSPGKLHQSPQSCQSDLSGPSLDDQNRGETVFKADDVLICVGCDFAMPFTSYLFELKTRLGVKIIHVCTEVGWIISPWLYEPQSSALYWENLANLLWCSDLCLCLCEQVSQEIRQFCLLTGTPLPPRLECVDIHPSTSFFQSVQARPAIKTDEWSYILCVSPINRSSNQEVVYRAYQRLMDNGYKRLPKLVLLGVSPAESEFLLELRCNPRLRAIIEIRQEVALKELSCLYAECLFTVLPTLCDDYPLSLIESLKHGKVCLASNLNVNRQVGGELLEYIDPINGADWAERIKFLLDNPEVLNRMEERIACSFCDRPESITSAIGDIIQTVEGENTHLAESAARDVSTMIQPFDQATRKLGD